MEKNNPQFITVPSQSVREFFDELSVLPLLIHSSKCEIKTIANRCHIFLPRRQGGRTEAVGKTNAI
jgi:hypothetical protein